MNYRIKANVTLAIVFATFIFTTAIRHIYPEVFAFRLIYFVLEAALVGGLADWFAVTALFRKPLGFSYHTALIPRNREKVIQGITNMVEGDLLSAQAIKSKISGVRFDTLAVGLLERNPEYKTLIMEQAGKTVVEYLINMDRSWAAEKLEKMVRTKLENLKVGEVVQHAVRWVFAQRMDEKWLDYTLEELARISQSQDTLNKLHAFLQTQKQQQTKDNFFKSLIAEVLISTDSLNLEEAARVLQSTLVQNLHQFKDPSHPVRLKIKEIILENFVEFEQDPAWLLSLERWKRVVLANFPLQEALQTLVSSLVEAATQPVQSEVGAKPPIQIWIEQNLDRYWEQFKQDEALGAWFDKWCKEIIVRIIGAEHYLVGEIVKQTLESLSNADLNKFIEDKAGDDLQWIRINGSLVGGAIGLLLFLFISFVYDPFVVPVVLGWFK